MQREQRSRRNKGRPQAQAKAIWRSSMRTILCAISVASPTAAALNVDGEAGLRSAEEATARLKKAARLVEEAKNELEQVELPLLLEIEARVRLADAKALIECALNAAAVQPLITES